MRSWRRSRIFGSKERTLRASFAYSGITLTALPAWIVPTVTTVVWVLDPTAWVAEAAFCHSELERIGVLGKIDTAEAFAWANGHKVESHAGERRRGIQPLRCRSIEGPASVLGRF
jgi:hypothetical protein